MIEVIELTYKPEQRGMRPKAIHLEPEDEHLLRQIVVNAYWHEWQIRKAEVVLGIAGGERVCDVSERLHYSPASI